MNKLYRSRENRQLAGICGGPGVFNVARDYLSRQFEDKDAGTSENDSSSLEKTHKGLKYFLHTGCVYLQFYHPSYFGKNQKEFYDLLFGSMDTVRRAFKAACG